MFIQFKQCESRGDYDIIPTINPTQEWATDYVLKNGHPPPPGGGKAEGFTKNWTHMHDVVMWAGGAAIHYYLTR